MSRALHDYPSHCKGLNDNHCILEKCLNNPTVSAWSPWTETIKDAVVDWTSWTLTIKVAWTLALASGRGR